MTDAPRFAVREIELFERPVRLRLPFRFGVVTLTRVPAGVRARAHRVRAMAASAWGAAAETDGAQVVRQEPAALQRGQLRPAARRAARWRAMPTWPMRRRPPPSATSRATTTRTAGSRGRARLQPAAGQLRPGAGRPRGARRAVPAARRLVLRRDAAQPARHRPQRTRSSPASTSTASSRGLRPAATIEARHTVGLVDAITAADLKERVGDGLPETLEEVVAATATATSSSRSAARSPPTSSGCRRIAAVLDRSAAPYFASLDGNEQYDDAAGVAELVAAHPQAAPQLARLWSSILFIEQPIARKLALRRGPARRRPGQAGDHRRVRRRARRLRAGARARLCGRVVQDLQGRVQVAPQRRALRRVEPRARRPALLHVGRRPDHAGRPVGAAGPGAGEPAGHHARGAQRPPLRERHGGAAAGRAAGLPRRRIPTCTSAATARCGWRSATAASPSRSLDGPGYASGAMPDFGAMRALGAAP